MSSEAPKVPKVEIELSERGLTDLAQMLVKSGVLSAPSFKDWATRTSQHASRWARPNRKTEAKGKAKGKGSSGSKTTSDKVEKVTKKDQKAEDTISGFKKIFPDSPFTTFKEILELEAEGFDEVANAIALKRAEVDAFSKDKILEFFESVKMTPDEIRQSKKYFPVLKKVDKSAKPTPGPKPEPNLTEVGKESESVDVPALTSTTGGTESVSSNATITGTPEGEVPLPTTYAGAAKQSNVVTKTKSSVRNVLSNEVDQLIEQGLGRDTRPLHKRPHVVKSQHGNTSARGGRGFGGRK